jgi:hypothetical protein
LKVERVECPKCGARMEAGYILDVAHGANLQSQWVEGPPDRSRWTGLKLKGRRKLPVTSYRCSRCGFLESWATGLA